MTGLERRSAFVPVPSTLTNYSSNSSLGGDLLKFHQESSLDYSNMSYYNHLPHSVPSIPIHSYNRSHVPSHLHQASSTFQSNTAPNDNDIFHPMLPSSQPNDKLLVKVSDSTMMMADVKTKVKKSKAQNKRKLDALSTVTSNILGSSFDSPSSSDKLEVGKRRKTKSKSDSNISSQNNNNTQISIKVDVDQEWDINTELNSSGNSKPSPSSTISPSKVNSIDRI